MKLFYPWHLKTGINMYQDCLQGIVVVALVLEVFLA